MKKMIIALLVALVLVAPIRLWAAAGVPLPSPVEERIRQFHADIEVKEVGNIVVRETITYDFGSFQKHGFFRFIPVDYTGKSGTNYSVRLKVLSVVDEALNPYTYKTSHSGDSLEIKIGDADKLVSGLKTYIITYQIERGLSYFADHDELYWNVFGPKWEVPIDEASATITLPQTLPASDSASMCYTGFVGSTDTYCSIKKSEENGKTVLEIKGERQFSPGMAFTVVVGFPKGVVAEPSTLQKTQWFLFDNWPFALPFLSFLVMFVLWHKKGREPQGKGVVIAQYEPPRKLSPIEVGTLINQRVDKHDISSIMIDLAVRGFIKIRYISKTFSKDYEFVKLNNTKELVRPYEQLFFKELFGNAETKKLSSLKNKFYETTKEVTKQVYQKLTLEGFFVKNPQTIRLAYIGIGFIVGVIGIPASGANQNTAFFHLLAFGLAGGIIALFGLIMPQYTKLGAEVREEIEGFKLFLSVTEKERLKFHNAPSKKPELFEKYLPYAMALKVEKEWANQFKDMYLQPPSWYEGNWTTFNMIAFTSSLNSFSSSASSAFVSSPSGSSGFSGSSGGGFGGGGGGSW